MNIDERDSMATRFGVSTEQIERDHLISHLLAAITGRLRDRIHFIGGTALARSYLPMGRLSEDIDLVALVRRTAISTELDDLLPRALARTHGRLRWDPPFAAAQDDASAAQLCTDSGLSVKVQLLSSLERTVWPAELRTLEQRYSDAPPARLFVPTLPASVAAKTAAWHDRRAPRDLWDLWALAAIGAISESAGDLYRRYGPTNRLPAPHLFDSPPHETEWIAQLAGQTRLTVTAVEALSVVRDAWARLTRPDSDDETKT